MSATDQLSEKKKILLFGMSPMPFENDKKVYGTGIRTWQFLMPLLQNGCKICVCNYAIPSAYDKDFKNLMFGDFEVIADGKKFTFEYNILKGEDFEDVELLKGIYTRFKPDCIIGCSFYPSYIASRLIGCLKEEGVKNINNNNKDASSIPFWADLFGHVMAEAQARAYIDNSDECLFHYWNSEYSIISTADVFSAVSERQKYALIGELGAVGRLNMHTNGYEFAYCIPCGIPPEPFKHKKNVLNDFKEDATEIVENNIRNYAYIDHDSGSIINGDIGTDRNCSGINQDGIGIGGESTEKDKKTGRNNAFIVLWTGGYNTWTDIDTLYGGLIKAMEKNKNIKFVSTGGEIPEQDIKTYPRFLKMIENSQFRDNFIMKGWIKGEDVPNYYFESDIGINIDKDIYEVRLGSKNRILDWFRAGLCVLSSNVCELTEIIERENIGYTFKAGDPDDLANKIIFLAGNKDLLKQTALRGQKFAYDNFNFKKTTEALQNWTSNPLPAPDSGKENSLNFQKDDSFQKLELIAENQQKLISQKDRRIQELETIVQKSFVYRLYAYFRILKRKIFR